VVHRTDRADDGTVIETTVEWLARGVPGRRIVRVPAHGVELVDTFGYRPSGGLEVLGRRTIEARIGNRVVVDLTMTGTGEIRLAPGRALRELARGSPFLPERLEAQDCGVGLLIRFVGATLSVIAAVSTCAASGPVCLFGVVASLIDWAECIAEMEACNQAI
jgi:hypothetical protein